MSPHAKCGCSETLNRDTRRKFEILQAAFNASPAQSAPHRAGIRTQAGSRRYGQCATSPPKHADYAACIHIVRPGRNPATSIASTTLCLCDIWKPSAAELLCLFHQLTSMSTHKPPSLKHRHSPWAYDSINEGQQSHQLRRLPRIHGETGEALRCGHCKARKTGRNLVVALDGTMNQFGLKNTNVVEIYARIEQNNEQLKYYSSGIGTYANPSRKHTWTVLKKNGKLNRPRDRMEFRENHSGSLSLAL